jgi:alkanesulfonate monooxygenase SsuD/methylene tetrahydromethanopterin reductase-like flavin-dependent oxidoreductase (luciferase family)
VRFALALLRRPDWSTVRTKALAAESAGFDAVTISDHLNWPSALLEAFAVASALAVTTTRIEIVFGVLAQGFRSPALAAKSATAIDLMSGGRLRFGIGAGTDAAEHAAYGLPFARPDQLVEQVEEAAAICRGMFDAGGAPFSFAGKHHRVAGALNLPPPGRRIPLLIAGGGDRMLDVVARHADEWNCGARFLPSFAERSRALSARLGGRSVRRSLNIPVVSRPPDDSERSRRYNLHLALVPPAERMVDRLREVEAAGFDEVWLAPVDDRADEIALEVVPELRAALPS